MGRIVAIFLCVALRLLSFLVYVYLGRQNTFSGLETPHQAIETWYFYCDNQRLVLSKLRTVHTRYKYLIACYF